MYELRVLTGLHRGAALPLIGNQWKIGADQLSDLTLKDAGVKPSHCLMIQKGGQFKLYSKRGTVTNDEGHDVPSIDNVKPGEPFALGGTWLCLEQESAPWPESPSVPQEAPPGKRVLTPAFLGISFAAALAATGALASLGNDNKSTPEMAENAESIQREPEKIILDGDREVKLTLLNMLSERELDTLVSVEQDEKGIFLGGSLSPQQLLLLRRMLNRLHLNFDVRLPIENRVTQKEHKLPFKIVQIISGRLAHVVTNDGRRLFVGDEHQGMRLMSIDKNQVTFDGAWKIEVKW